MSRYSDLMADVERLQDDMRFQKTRASVHSERIDQVLKTQEYIVKLLAEAVAILGQDRKPKTNEEKLADLLLKGKVQVIRQSNEHSGMTTFEVIGSWEDTNG